MAPASQVVSGFAKLAINAIEDELELAVRATDEKGNTQPDEPVWNPGRYLWNRIERQEIAVGNAR